MRKNGLRVCKKCRQHHPTEDYIVQKKLKDTCPACRYENQNKKRLKHYADIALTKDMPKCAVCGIILTEEICRCGKQHGLPSKKDSSICEDCVSKGWEDRKGTEPYNDPENSLEGQ